jgi:hypothetical protein
MVHEKCRRNQLIPIHGGWDMWWKKQLERVSFISRVQNKAAIFKSMHTKANQQYSYDTVFTGKQTGTITAWKHTHTRKPAPRQHMQTQANNLISRLAPHTRNKCHWYQNYHSMWGHRKLEWTLDAHTKAISCQNCMHTALCGTITECAI